MTIGNVHMLCAALVTRRQPAMKSKCYRAVVNVPTCTTTHLGRPTRPRLDLRTLSLAVAILGGYVLWTLSFTALPLWLAAPLGAVIIAWYGSLSTKPFMGIPRARSG